VQMGIDLSGIVTFRSMRDALRHHIRLVSGAAVGAAGQRDAAEVASARELDGTAR
jgi:hypothetical protein